MPKSLEPLEILERVNLERDESEIATRAKLDRVQLRINLLASELRGPGVSSKYPTQDIERLESFADRLIQENVRKQAEPAIVARNVRRASRLMAESPRATYVPKQFVTAYRPRAVRADVSPRTVFGTEAWFRPFINGRYKFVNKTLSLPCVERSVRKQVMFAKRKAGVGYRVRHRVLPHNNFWC